MPVLHRHKKGTRYNLKCDISIVLVIVLGQGSALLQDAYRHRATAVEGGESPFRSDAQCPYDGISRI